VAEIAVCYFIGIAHAHQIKVEWSWRDKPRDFEVLKQSCHGVEKNCSCTWYTAILQRFQHPPKKPTRKRACVFKPDFAKKLPELTQGRKGESFAFRPKCVCEFSVKSGGLDDCRRHNESEKHSRHSSSGSGKHPTATVPKLTSFFPLEKPSEKNTLPLTWQT
jgi:hypothetical protein